MKKFISKVKSFKERTLMTIAIHMFMRGYSMTQIARVLHQSDSTVKVWLAWYKAQVAKNTVKA